MWLNRPVVRGVLLIVLAGALGCSGGDDIPAGEGGDAHDRAARAIVAFLRGEDSLTVALADTVTLRLGTEGGGDSVRIARQRLRDPQAWAVSMGDQSVSFVPGADMTLLTTEPGAHFRCFPQELAISHPDLAGRPHVGAKLEPVDALSCLQTWNVTFVFDESSPPRLVAAIYDQWEW